MSYRQEILSIAKENIQKNENDLEYLDMPSLIELLIEELQSLQGQIRDLSATIERMHEDR